MNFTFHTKIIYTLNFNIRVMVMQNNKIDILYIVKPCLGIWFNPIFTCISNAESLMHRILVGNQRERTTLGCGFLSFHVYFGDNSVLFRYCLVQRPSCMFLLFSSDLWSGIFFLFLLSPTLWLGIFFLFCFLPLFWLGIFFLFCFLPLFDWELSFFFCFLPRARINILTLVQGLW